MKRAVLSVVFLVAGGGWAAGAGADSISSQCATVPAVPPAPASAKAVRSSGGDDTASLQSALDGLTPGTALILQPGTFNISKHLTIRVSGVSLYGSGATLHATNPADGALLIQSSNVSVYGVTLTQAITTRQTTPWAGGISVWGAGGRVPQQVTGIVIQNNTINGASGGIFVSNASLFTVAGNTVYRTLADGIHMTGGAMNGRVIGNVVSQNGDDMIAVVSYAGNLSAAAPALKYANWTQQQAQLVQNIYIGGNTVSDQYWGRGISVVGGSNVTIENNSISKTAIGAGIYLTRETANLTFGDQNIYVDGNTISHVQTDPPTYQPPGFSGAQTKQGAIEIGAQMTPDESGSPAFFKAFSISNIALVGNQINDARYAGIRIGIFSPSQSISQIDVDGNAISNVGNASIVQAVLPGLNTATLTCSGNSLNGVNWGAVCDKSIAPVTASYAVTGSGLQCNASGQITAGQSYTVPQPPSQIQAH